MKKIPDTLIVELERIAAAHGGILQPDTVVESARNPSSPLHSRFQWNNTEAAHQWRLEQARHLIRIVVKLIPNTEIEERVWVSLKQDQQKEGGGYRTLVSVLTDADMRAKLLEQAMDDMAYFQEKYSRLNELASVFSAYRKIQRKMKK